MDVISRDEAIQQGLKYYFTGAPCKHGHISKRIVSSHACHECRREMLERKAQEKGVTRRPKTEEERRQRRNAALKKYRDSHPEKIKESQKIFRLSNPERSKEIKNAWTKKQSKEYFRLKSHKRRASMVGSISKDIVDFLKKMQRGLCAACKSELLGKYEIDHIVPLAKGGLHADENLQLLCPPCNRSKSAKHPVDFMQERGYLL
jgi:5-methylcytosine-specific restriction endonuclease McrA